ncbi:hypothetical protein DEJ50_03750 [Streptomyces venezuelae]|uniref:Uncharacterized protein n=1 Tax=Streptomyces venezuelae TaxID=54571 RepID=A0A5P2D172_STRVZ|nr:hypothetical protein [Streptomyces venezuelae]QES47091.1 hypothetical protein DEJ50_03750 [Streptomyces venezuelae]
MHRIEFFRYSPADYWGVRVDGTDLRLTVADATRSLREREADAMAAEPGGRMTAQERTDFLARRHGGMRQEDLGAPAAYFLGEHEPAFRCGTEDGTPVLGCSCGVWECGPLLARITVTADTVIWSRFRDPYRPAWGELPIGPYVFPRAAYETALAHPFRLAHDPLPA